MLNEKKKLQNFMTNEYQYKCYSNVIGLELRPIGDTKPWVLCPATQNPFSASMNCLLLIKTSSRIQFINKMQDIQTTIETSTVMSEARK